MRMSDLPIISGPLLQSVVVLQLSPVGTLVKNVSPSEWKRLTQRERALVATVRHYGVMGFKYYLAEVTNDIDDNIVATYHRYQYVSCSAVELKSKIASLVEDREFYTGMQNACVIATEGTTLSRVRVVNLVTLKKSPDFEEDEDRSGETASLCLRCCVLYAPSALTVHRCWNPDEPRFNVISHVMRIHDGLPVARLTGAVDYLESVVADLSKVSLSLREGTGRPEMFKAVTGVSADRVDVVLDEVQEAAQSIRPAMDRVAALSHIVERAVEEGRDKIETTVVEASQLIKEVRKLVATFAGGVEDLGVLSMVSSSGLLLGLVSFAVDAWHGAYCQKNGVYDVLRAVLRITSILGLAAPAVLMLVNVFRRSYESLVSWFSPEIPLGNQTEGAARAEAPGMPGFVPLVAALIGTLVLGKNCSKSEVDRVMILTRGFNMAVPAMGNLSSLLSYVISYLPVCVRAWLSFICPSEALLCKLIGDGEFETWAAEVAVVCSPEQVKHLAYNVIAQEAVVGLHARGSDILLKMATELTGADGTKLYTLVLKYMALVDKALKIVYDARGSAGKRSPPFSLYLAGEPGVGKSVLAGYIRDLLVPSDTPEELKCYSRNPGTTFWDGYRGQVAVVLDDFGQDREGLDIMEYIQMVTPATFVLPMASLDNPVTGAKGTQFTSKIVIACSNMPYPTPDPKIRVEMALWRRRHLLWLVRPRPECRLPGGSLDLTKRTRDFGHLEFVRADPCVSGRNSQPVDFETMLRVTRREYAAHVAHEAEMEKEFSTSEILDRLRAEPENDFFGPRSRSLHHETLDQRYDYDADGTLYTYVEPEGEARPEVLTLVERMQKVGLKLKDVNVLTPGLQEAVREEVMARAEEDQKSWSERHPRLKKFLALCALSGTVLGLLALFFAKRGELKPESVSERTKNMRKQPRQRVVNESGELLKRKKDILKEVSPSSDAMREVLQAEDEVRVLKEMELRKEAVSPEHSQRVLDYVKSVAIKAEVEIVKAKLTPNAIVAESLVVGQTKIERLQEKIREEDLTDEQRDRFDDLLMRAVSLRGRLRQFVRDAEDQEIGTEERESMMQEVRELYSAMDAAFETTVFGDIGSALPSVGPECAFIRPEGTNDPNARDIAHKCVMPNMFQISSERSLADGRTSEKFILGMMVRGKVGLIPRHFFIEARGMLIPANTLLTVVYAERKMTVKFDPKNLVFIENGVDGGLKDVVLYYFGDRAMSYRDCVSKFVRVADLGSIYECPGTIVTWERDDKATSTIFVGRMKVNDREEDNRPPLSYPHDSDVMSSDAEIMRVFTSIDTYVDTQPGMCGSVVVAYNSRIPNKILGMHVAGVPTDNKGVAEIVTFEDLEKGLSKLPLQVLPPKRPVDLAPHPEGRAVPQGDFSVIGVVAGSEAPRSPERTRIRRSPLFDRVFRHVTEPACLSPFDERLEKPGISMLVAGTEKYGKESPPLDVETMRAAQKYTRDQICQVLAREPRFIMTEKEAINGKACLAFCDSMNMQTSAGMPYVVRKGMKVSGKRQFFTGEENELVVSDQELRERLDTRLALAKRGKRMWSVAYSCLKDERRPLAKVRAGKTRVFIIMPLDFTILVRQYFLAYISAQLRNSNVYYSTPGIDVESMQWTKLMEHLLEVSDVGIAGDYGNWDGSVKAEVMAAHVNNINAWYDDGEENALIRRVLYDEVIHTILLCGTTMLMKHHGVPSGFPGTTNLNTDQGEFMMAVCWYELAPEDERDLVFFARNTRGKVYGDDHVYAVRRAALLFFNMVRISAFLRSIGIEYTAPDKNEESMKPYGYLREWTFLKRGSRKVGKQWLPVIGQEVIAELTNWVTDSADPWTLCNESCADACRYAWFYGPEFFDNFCEKVMAVVNALGPNRLFVLPSYEFFANHWAKKNGLPLVTYKTTGGIDQMWEFARRYEGVAAAQSGRVITGGDTELSTEVVTRDPLMGTTLVAQSEAVVTPLEGATDAAPLGRDGMSDREWDMRNMVEKSVLVGAFPWSTANGQGTVLRAWLLPFGMISATSVTHEPFSLFAFWRGNVKITATVSGTQFHTGRAILYHAPMIDTTYGSLRFVGNRQRQSGLQHCMLDPSRSSTVALVVPFQCPLEFINLISQTTSDMMGSVYLEVFNPLVAGTGASTTVSVSVHVQFMEAKFHIPHPRDFLVSRNKGDLQEMEGILKARLRQVRRAQPGGEAAVLRDDQIEALRGTRVLEMVIREMEERVEDAEGVARPEGNSISYNLKNSAMKAGPIEKMGNEFARGAKAEVSIPAAAFDKPLVGLEGAAVVRQALGNFANANNVIAGEVLKLNPGEQDLAEPQDFGNTVDETSISWLVQKKMFEQEVSWNVGTPSGSILMTGLIGPMSQIWFQNLGTTFTPTILDFVSMKFDVWRGEIILTLDLVASTFHTGRLMVAAHYGSTVVPASMDAAMSDMIGYIELNNVQHEFEFVFPFISARRCLRVAHGRTSNVIGDTPLDSFTGVYSIWVVNALVTPAGTPASVSINMWKSGGPNYRVSGLNINNATIQIGNAFSFLAEGEEGVARPESGRIILGTEAHTTVRYGFEEKIDSVVDCCKRFSGLLVVDNAQLAATASGTISDATLTLITGNFTQAFQEFGSGVATGGTGMLPWFGSIYRAWKGPFNLRVQYDPTWNRIPVLTATGSGQPRLPYPTFTFPTASALNGYPAASFSDTVQVTFVPYTPSGTSGLAIMATAQNSRETSFFNTGMAMTSTDPAANYTTVEIPFMSTFKFCMTLQSALDFPARNQASSGTIAIAATNPTDQVLGTGAPPGVVLNGRMRLWVAAGDTFQFGLFISTPECVIGSGNIGYDTYSASSLAHDIVEDDFFGGSVLPHWVTQAVKNNK